MRVENPSMKGTVAYTKFPPVRFDQRGVSEELPPKVGHYLRKFPGYQPAKQGPRQETVQEPTEMATKKDLLAYCERNHIADYSEKMNKRQLLELIHAFVLEKRGHGRMAEKAEGLSTEQPSDETEELTADQAPEEAEE